MSEIAQALQRVAHQDHEALDRVFADSYPDLKRIAHARLRGSGLEGHLQTTALVHESYLKLAGGREREFPDRLHFLSYASRTLRSIVIDIVRERRAQRRGGDLDLVTLDTAVEAGAGAGEMDVERVNAAIQDLAKLDEGLAHLVEMRFFGGLSEEEIAEALGTSVSTVHREWTKARALLHTLLAG